MRKLLESEQKTVYFFEQNKYKYDPKDYLNLMKNNDFKFSSMDKAEQDKIFLNEVSLMDKKIINSYLTKHHS